MSAPSLPEIRQRLLDELEIILGRPMRDGDARRQLPELGIDSIGLVELLVMIEKEFGQSLMESGLTTEDFRSVERLAAVIRARLE